MPTATTAAESLVCPAAVPIEEVDGKGPGAHCNIAKVTMNRHDDQRTLAFYCSRNHEACPIWQRQKEAEAKDQHRDLEREILASTPRAER